VDDDEVAVIVLAGAGKHFSAGHDIGTPERDIDQSFPRTASLWWDHVGKPGAENRFARESEVYLGMCRRWREIPKPTIAMVQGACIAGGLMLAWCCDLVVAADDAFFADPVVRMGIPGVEYFAHPWEFGPRKAKELLLTGDSLSVDEAHQLGMVSKVFPLDELEDRTLEFARRIASQPTMSSLLIKEAVNQSVDNMGFYNSLNACFTLHELNHSHWAQVHDDGFPAAKEEDGIPNWKSAPPIVPAVKDQVRAEG
jgi:enoyl-CoA hydratase